MNPSVHQFLSLDLLPMLAATLAAVSCGLLGNFLVLRRQSLMGDAISHAVLPGLVAAFLITGLRSPIPMFIGAAVAGVATVVLVEVIKKLGRVEPGAAMGVVFSVLFALGVLLLEQAAARQVDLDAECVLHGQLEMLFWFPPGEWSALITPSTLATVPRQVWTLVLITVLAFSFVGVFFKELRIAAFDPALATAQGFHAGVLHYALMVFVAAAAVASFEAVGSILVIAMLICPAATARLLTDRMHTQVLVSVVVAIITGVGGYLLATRLPAHLGLPEQIKDVNAAGMMTVVAGSLVTLAVFLSPRHGVIGRLLRRRKLGRRVLVEDLLGTLYRASEREQASVDRGMLGTIVGAERINRALALALAQNLIATEVNTISLTAVGRREAAEVIRRHRLWEHYLVDEGGLTPDHVHAPAELLEHIGEPHLRKGSTPHHDPHGRKIPDPPDAS